MRNQLHRKVILLRDKTCLVWQFIQMSIGICSSCDIEDFDNNHNVDYKNTLVMYMTSSAYACQKHNSDACLCKFKHFNL